jgi:hypothetical protein
MSIEYLPVAQTVQSVGSSLPVLGLKEPAWQSVGVTDLMGQ